MLLNVWKRNPVVLALCLYLLQLLASQLNPMPALWLGQSCLHDQAAYDLYDKVIYI